MTDNRNGKIIAAAAMGAFLGVLIGVLVLDSAGAGAAIFGLIAAYLMHLKLTREEAGHYNAPDVMTLDPHGDGHYAVNPSPIEDIKQAGRDAVPVMERFLTGCWNLLMKGLAAIGAMKLLRKYPWIFVVLILLLLILVFPVGLVLLFAGLIALDRKARPEDDFILPSRDTGFAGD